MIKKQYIDREKQKPFTREANYKIDKDGVSTLRERWEFTESQNANADSKVGWSTAFFGITISAFLTIGFSVSWNLIWYVLAPFITLNIISIILLIIAMNPSYKIQKSRTLSGQSKLHYLYVYTNWKDIVDEDFRKVDYRLFDELEANFFSESKKGNKIIVNSNEKEEHFWHEFSDDSLSDMTWGNYYDNYIKKQLVDLNDNFEVEIFNMNNRILNKLNMLKLAYSFLFTPFAIYNFIMYFGDNDQFGVIRSNKDKYIEYIKNKTTSDTGDTTNYYFGLSDTVEKNKSNLTTKQKDEMLMQDKLEWTVAYIQSLRNYVVNQFDYKFTRTIRWIKNEYYRDIDRYDKELPSYILKYIKDIDVIGSIELEEIVTQLKSLN